MSREIKKTLYTNLTLRSKMKVDVEFLFGFSHSHINNTQKRVLKTIWFIKTIINITNKSYKLRAYRQYEE